jgi:hypothetical protein
MRGHFNDLFLIPAALPLMLWVHRRLGLRTHDEPPRAGEILLHLLVWTFIAECAGPFLTNRGTADWADVAAYSAGAAVCYVFWRGRKFLAGWHEPSYLPFQMPRPMTGVASRAGRSRG